MMTSRSSFCHQFEKQKLKFLQRAKNSQRMENAFVGNSNGFSFVRKNVVINHGKGGQGGGVLLTSSTGYFQVDEKMGGSDMRRGKKVK